MVEKAKSWASSGTASLMIVIVPRWTFVKTHVTVSPGSSWKVAVRVPTLPVLGVALASSLQTIAPRSKFGAGSVSVEV